MKIETAIKVIQKDADFLGLSFQEMMQFVQKNPLAQPQTTMLAYSEIAKQEIQYG